MTSFRTRPRFRQSIELTRQELIEKIKSKAQNEVEVSYYDSYFQLSIPKRNEHYWSPRLNVNMYEEEDGSLRLSGRYGPHPSIWTMFAFAYSALGLSFLIIAMYGFSRLSLGLSYDILWILPFILVGIATLYFSAQFGQKMGAEQTFRIHSFLEEAIDHKIQIA